MVYLGKHLQDINKGNMYQRNSVSMCLTLVYLSSLKKKKKSHSFMSHPPLQNNPCLDNYVMEHKYIL